MKTLSFLCATFLLLALFRLPIEYYTFLRVITTFGAILIIKKEVEIKISIWIFLFGILAIIFNPVFPIYLYKKPLWMPIDISGSILFFCYFLKLNAKRMFQNLFSFDGRIRRFEYGLSLIFYVIGAIIIISIKNNIIVLAYIPLIWALWAQGAKRCHDMNHSGWMQLVPFYFFWMLLQEGDNYPNSYGNDPKDIEKSNRPFSQKSNFSTPKPTPVMIPVITMPENQTTVLEVSNINYSLIQDIMKNLRNLDLIKNQSYTFSENTATITIHHRDTSQVLLDGLYSIMQNIEVLSVGNGSIKIKIK